MNSSKIVIFSDIDGTIIDDNYSLKETQSIISEILKNQVLFVLCSSKTRAEIEYYRNKLGIKDPFISENGAAIFIPKGYFDFSFNCSKQTSEFDVIELGIAYAEIRKKIRKMEKTGSFKITGFGDMTSEEVAKGTGLPLRLAILAKQREYSEPCIVYGKNEDEFSSLLRKEGLRYEKGRKYYNLIGNHDKGRAVALLSDLYVSKFGPIKSFAVGNDKNDFSMLKISDCSFFVEKNQSLNTIWTAIKKSLSVHSLTSNVA